MDSQHKNPKAGKIYFDDLNQILENLFEILDGQTDKVYYRAVVLFKESSKKKLEITDKRTHKYIFVA